MSCLYSIEIKRITNNNCYNHCTQSYKNILYIKWFSITDFKFYKMMAKYKNTI